MASLIGKWDQTKERLYETGVDRGVLYVMDENGDYTEGKAWNGLISVQETPGGAESNPVYANNEKYLDIRSAETLGGTIQAYTCPRDFYVCDGSQAYKGVGQSTEIDYIRVAQQARRGFGMSYRTIVGNDVLQNAFSYKLHLLYNATVSPTQREYQTVNESPEQSQLSWEFATTPIEVAGFKNKTSLLTIDVSQIALMPDGADKTAALAKIAALEAVLYGTNGVYTKVATPAAGSLDTYYELVNGVYVLTEDESIVANKDYYTQTTAPTDPTLPLPADLDEIFYAAG